jgi:hypothetical protein
LPAISHVFTINYVAEKLGEDEEWLWELQIDMFPEDGCLRVYGVGQDGVPAFTDYGIGASSKSSQTKEPPAGPLLNPDRRNRAGAVLTAC